MSTTKYSGITLIRSHAAEVALKLNVQQPKGDVPEQFMSWRQLHVATYENRMVLRPT